MTFNFTYIAKVFIQQLDISVQHFKGKELIILVLQTGTEIQAGISAGVEDKGHMLEQLRDEET